MLLQHKGQSISQNVNELFIEDKNEYFIVVFKYNFLEI